MKSGCRSGQTPRTASRPPGTGESVLERSAELVGPVIGDRREKLVDEIAVRGVDLDEIESAWPARTAAWRNADRVVDVGRRHLARDGKAVDKRRRRRPIGCQPPCSGRMAHAAPRGIRAGFPPRVRDLHAAAQPSP